MKKVLSSLLVLLIIIFIVNRAFRGSKETVAECEKEKSLAIKGKVKAIEPDEVNRAQKTIHLANGHTIYQIYTIGLWDQLRLGDSIVKEAGTLNYKIYRFPDYSIVKEIVWDKQCQ